MLDDMLDHLQSLRDQPVWREPPPELRARFREPLPIEPADLAAVHARFLETVLPFSSGNAHPRFMGWVQGGGTVVGMLAEMLAAGLNANLGGRDHMPIEVERQLVEWSRRIFRFPDTASGLFLSGGSQANFVGVLMARRRALGPEVRGGGLLQAGAQLTAYASTAVHSCVGRAMDMAGVGADHLRLIPVDEDGRIRLDILREAIAADRDSGLRPFLVVGTAGSVNVGAVDDLEALAAISAGEGMHFHVDGALGALGMLSPRIAGRLAGVEKADSLAFDWHKWGQAPYEAGFILARDAELQRATFAVEAAYLQREAGGLAGGEWWPCDYGPDLSRGFRALKVWFALKTYGAAAIGEAIANTCDLATELGRLVDAEPELERLAPIPLNIVCFRYRSADCDRLNAEIVRTLQCEGLAAPSLTQIEGRTAIRAAIVNHRTRPSDIEALVSGVLRQGRALAGGPRRARAGG